MYGPPACPGLPPGQSAVVIMSLECSHGCLIATRSDQRLRTARVKENEKPSFKLTSAYLMDVHNHTKGRSRTILFRRGVTTVRINLGNCIESGVAGRATPAYRSAARLINYRIRSTAIAFGWCPRLRSDHRGVKPEQPHFGTGNSTELGVRRFTASYRWKETFLPIGLGTFLRLEQEFSAA